MRPWQERCEEENYLGHLEQVVVQRLRCEENSELPKVDRRRQRQAENLNRFSVEINEELDRLERLLADSEQNCGSC